MITDYIPLVVPSIAVVLGKYLIYYIDSSKLLKIFKNKNFWFCGRIFKL